MSPDEAFLTLHRALPRQGPGAPEDVAWAIERLGLSGRVRILDAGCGPGADLETFAALLPEARLEGIDAVAHLAAEARARVPGASVRVGDMAHPGGNYDLIWCAGAIYFLGVTEGLEGWRTALAPGGAVAFSEPVMLATGRAEAEAFWADYPAITDLAGLHARIGQAGYEILDERLIQGAPWALYYEPLAERIATLRPNADAALGDVLDAAEREIAQWRAAPEAIVYALMLVRPL